MPRCTRLGCQKEYSEEENVEGSCSYHPGGPVFHEGLKSWSCCKDVSKPVLEFDQFMAIPRCAKGKHSTEPPANAPTSTTPSAPTTYTTTNGVETYGAAPAPSSSTPPQPSSAPAVAAPRAPPVPVPAAEPEEDDPTLPVPDGAKCKRLACGQVWAGESVSRGKGEKAVCRHHPQAPVFHEGSKGYLCCKRRVLEFDEFMKIEGCTEGKHLFVGSKPKETTEELVTCRIDHYQTPTQVHVSLFAKAVIPSASSIAFTPQTLLLDLALPGNKRIKRELVLYGAIDPEQCKFAIRGTKVDVTLQKPSAASWPLLELPPEGTELPPGYALTFGVKGRTGTVGGKEIVLAPEEVARREREAQMGATTAS